MVENRHADAQPPAEADGRAWRGYGLTGRRERAELLGGDLDAGRTAEGFKVRLWLGRTSPI
jgi:signal transduction histidine kinase